MSLNEHVEEALTRLDSAERKIRACQEEEASLENMHTWLSALTDYVIALADTHELDREQIDGHLHEVAQRVGLERLTAPRRRPGSSRR